ncbi:hypothetical protein BDA96_03G094500 [Sorghum bicolor]|uniref:Uncharacterized protein n=1 Tax=Sorghum bicolor TaxID=4558 RepID=A0A921RAV5_SORBI|nr:hypothetical protein BDA96_03G094500 [Sorghum bicolor]
MAHPYSRRIAIFPFLRSPARPPSQREIGAFLFPHQSRHGAGRRRIPFSSLPGTRSRRGLSPQKGNSRACLGTWPPPPPPPPPPSQQMVPAQPRTDGDARPDAKALLARGLAVDLDAFECPICLSLFQGSIFQASKHASTSSHLPSIHPSFFHSLCKN